MEIERKFLIKQLPENLERFPHHHIEQAYLSTDPVIRIRKWDDLCFLTVKSKGLLAREEYEMPIEKERYDDLLRYKRGHIITKTRYVIREKDGLKIELDIFEGIHKGLIMAEVEFPDLNTAKAYVPAEWFGEEVTGDEKYQNSWLSSH